MQKNIAVIIFCCCICGNAFAGFGPDSAKQSHSMDSILNIVNNRLSHKAEGDSAINNIIAMSKTDTVLQKAYREYQLFGLMHRRETLQWNLTSTMIIFWIVIFLVLTGIVFAGLQFYKAMKIKKTGAADPNMNLATEMEASIKGIKISSPVLGVIILVISLLFFYLYLVYVYPIDEIF